MQNRIRTRQKSRSFIRIDTAIRLTIVLISTLLVQLILTKLIN